MLFLKLVQEGGSVMWIILACGILALLIFLEKTFQFHREEINVRELLRGLTNVLDRDGIVEALTLCDNTPGPVARLLGAAILAYERGDENIRQAIDDAALDEMPHLEKHLNFLGTLGFILPLLGLLGTVFGMMGTYGEVLRANSVDVAVVARSVSQALLTTAAGLTLAIPCYMGYNYLVSRVNTISLDMEKAALEICWFFERKAKPAERKDD